MWLLCQEGAGIVAQQLKLLLGLATSHKGVLAGILAVPLVDQLLATTPWKMVGAGSSAGVPATPMGGADGILDFWIKRGLTLIFGTHLESETVN